MTIADNLTALAEQKLGYQDSVEACKTSLINKDVVVPVGAKLADISGLIDEIQQDPSIPVGTGKWLITWWDYDGKVLKRQRVNTGENGTDPPPPQHQYLTFAEYNNPTTNVQSDIDTGAIYNTTDGKTYLFITLTPVTGLAPTLYFSKSSTSLMTIDWGDGTTSTSTTSGNQSINHVYATAGDYIITVDNSAGGLWNIGQGTAATALFSNGTYKNCIYKLYAGDYIGSFNASSLQNCSSLRNIILKKSCRIGNNCFSYCSLEFLIYPVITVASDVGQFTYNRALKKIITTYPYVGSNTTFGYCFGLNYIYIQTGITDLIYATFFQNYALKEIILPSTLTNIGQQVFDNCLNITVFVFLSTTPPTLQNINAFTGINPICKIYVPDASVEAYKTATNWVTYANYIYPLSQKPQSDE